MGHAYLGCIPLKGITNLVFLSNHVLPPIMPLSAVIQGRIHEFCKEGAYPPPHANPKAPKRLHKIWKSECKISVSLGSETKIQGLIRPVPSVDMGWPPLIGWGGEARHRRCVDLEGSGGMPRFFFIKLIEYGVSFCILKYKSLSLYLWKRCAGGTR